MERQTLLKIALALNALIAAMEIGAVIFGVTTRSFTVFMYYTVLSNLLGGIACATCFICELRELRQGTSLPNFARLLKYAASCCLLMTFIVVVFILAPAYYNAGMDGFYLLFGHRELFITHLLGPLLVCTSYMLFEADKTMTLKQSFAGFLPTLIYAAVAYPCNIAKLWHGPYPFFFVWEMPLWQSLAWFAALCVLSIGLCQIIRLLGRRVCLIVRC
ncbi:MAG: hypothetical protein IKE43_01290 [Coriobacteriales bacterium]|nr:hypothetical protein [Coriobacteriales bacterium]